MTIHTPDWVKHAVFYQIFPDRFARSPRTRHPRGIRFRPWGSPPEEQGFQGGDLRGIVDRLDYLQALGVNALYLNPVFASAANHRYHPYDYLQVDPLLGDNDALRELLDAAHAKGMRVILDGVFNHASRGFWPFHHILENGADSPYVDWFIIHDWPLRAYHSDAHNPPNYEAWIGLPMLPKLNIHNPGVRGYILEVARHWIAFGIDGWRLDVPHEIDDDAFWQDFRRVVKTAKSDAYICGEIWHEARRWLQGDQFDAVMNYPLAWPALSFFGGRTLRTDYRKDHLHFKPLDAPDFARQVDYAYGLYDWEVNYVQLNLLDSHDTARALWIMGEDQSALKLCVLFQMTMPGAPCIYYGDEIGLSSGDDPYCRQAFPWQAEDSWDKELLDFYRRAIALRHAHPVLRTGTFQPLYAEGHVYAFYRTLDRQKTVVILNVAAQSSRVRLALPDTGPALFTQVWPGHDGGHSQPLEHGHLEVSVPARAGLVLINQT